MRHRRTYHAEGCAVPPNDELDVRLLQEDHAIGACDCERMPGEGFAT